MKHYEFKVISSRCSDSHPQSIVHLEATLNDLGKAGWTLASSTTVMGGTWLHPYPVVTAILQRERAPGGSDGVGS
jgi:hypothetical protein